MHLIIKSACIISLFFFGTAQIAYAGKIPNFDRVVSIRAVDQPIGSFLEELFSQLGLSVVVAEGVEGQISGVFIEKSAEKVFKEVSRSFALTAYFDGAIVCIYASSYVSQRMLAVSSQTAQEVIRTANELSMTDEKNYLQSSRNGGLIISGTPRFIEQVEELATAAESNLNKYKTPLTFRVFYLKYAWAQDVEFNFAGRRVVVPGVASIVSFLAEDGSATNFSRSYAPEYQSRSLDSLKGQGLAGEKMTSRGKRLGAVESGRYSYENGKPQSTTQSTNRSDVRIGVDPRLNAVIVRDSPERMPYYQALIDELDVEQKMVEIEATIIDINTSRLRELGINWRGINSNDEALFGSGNNSDLRLNPGGNITPRGEGGFVSFVLGDKNKFIGRINALEKEGAAKVISSPQVLTLSNVEALFNTSSTFHVRVAGNEEVDLFSVSVGTSLRVTPHIFNDKGVDKLKLLITIDDGQQENQKVDNIPVVTRSVINTQALIKVDESVLIGGIVREATLADETKVPLLGDLPIIGRLFKRKQNVTERVERMFLISPRLSVNTVGSEENVSKNKEALTSDINFYFEVKKKRAARYPGAARRKGIEGHCVIEYDVVKSGKPENVHPKHCSSALFVDAAVKAVKNYRYRARFHKSQMIDVPGVSSRINFKLSEK